MISDKDKKEFFPQGRDITKPAGFINAKEVSIAYLTGKKVVLVDFWTYSCINCQRSLPYLAAWYEKYKDQGLEIIGVHTPEFEFEKKYENVLWATKQFGINYPVVLDNDYATWHSYDNRYWPAKYLIDIDGRIVYQHFGEGAYQETERKIQELLEERAAKLGYKVAVPRDVVRPGGVEAPDLSRPQSPEIYFGAARNVYLGNGASEKRGLQTFVEPAGIRTNVLYLVGEWEIQNEFAENKNEGEKIIFRYQAQNVFMVASSEEKVRAKILLDGKPLAEEAGEDVRESEVTIKESRLYKLIHESKGWSEHTVEIIIESPGLSVFTFTFG